MRTALRWLIAIGCAATALMLVVAYATDSHPTLAATMVGTLACAVTGVWGWQKDL